MQVRKFLVRPLAALAALIALVSAGALGYRAWRQHENAEIRAITTPNGIDERMFVRIGGIDQWIEIRGEDRRSPVLLFLHGGPGGSDAPLSAIFCQWEKFFTVVMWDQRGAGKTYGRNGKSGCGKMTIARMTQDGIELTQFLHRYLHTDKIIVLGHSWGTVMGVLMIKRHPELYSAYVGTGQVVAIDEKEKAIYAATMKKLRAANDEAGIRALEQIGTPPYTSNADLEVERDWSERYDIASERSLRTKMTPVVLFAPGYSLLDIYQFLEAPKFAADALYREHLSYDARKVGTKFDVPFFIFNGEYDAITPSDLAERYFAEVTAPQKMFVLLKGGGHSAVLTMPDVFLRELITYVRPLTLGSSVGPSH